MSARLTTDRPTIRPNAGGGAAIALPAFLAIAMTMTACQSDAALESYTFEYPTYPASDVVEDYYGTPVADPWRGLEDPNSENQ